MQTIEIRISDIIIGHPEIDSFRQLLEAVSGISSEDVLFLNFDVKPDYQDTPRNWQWQLEAAFNRVGR
jgi:hypothetical protein